ncbi:MAG TPA: WD40 repeat domain-containing protein, partial [Pyrinomonadaceae bacterium]|nr:WD40 repeat domain-containing protein [Pyrinomonadaceae bacterium]
NEIATLAGHSNPVLAVAFSPDGSILATGSADATVKLWDIASRQILTTVMGCPLPIAQGAQTPSGRGEDSVCSVRALAFSPDGKTLAIGTTDKAVKLWDVVSRQQLAPFTGHSDSVTAVTFSPDGKILASGSLDRTVKLWDTASRRELATLEGHSNFVTAVTFSPDGKTFASGSLDRMVKLWDTASGKELVKFPGHLDSVSAVAFSPDGRTLATGSLDKTVNLWFAATDTEIADRRHQ